VNCYALAVQLGYEDQTAAGWIARAAELSPEGGPLWRVDLRTVIEEIVPAHRERVQEVERKVLKGEVPLHVAAAALAMIGSFLL
jgi:hypothetical protein